MTKGARVRVLSPFDQRWENNWQGRTSFLVFRRRPGFVSRQISEVESKKRPLVAPIGSRAPPALVRASLATSRNSRLGIGAMATMRVRCVRPGFGILRILHHV